MTMGWDRPRLRGRFCCPFPAALACLVLAIMPLAVARSAKAAPAAEKLPIDVPPVASDPAVKIDYDIVYVRAPRGTEKNKVYWANTEPPNVNPPGAELMVLHP